MNRTERFYKIDQMLNDRKVVSFQAMMDELEVSRATLKRDLAYLRDRLNAPIIYDRDAGGYRFDTDAKTIGNQYELPGLWFSAEEIHALLTMQHLLSNLDTGGLLGPHIKPLLSRLTALIGVAENPAEEVVKRIKIISVGARQMHLDHFQSIGSALLRRKRMIIRYSARGNGETTEREVSPQRLIHYRENWYLDAWCHLRDELRSFSPLLNFEWVMLREGTGSPRPGVKGGLRGYRSPAKRTLDAWNRAIRWPVAGCSGVVHPAMETSAATDEPSARVRCAPL